MLESDLHLILETVNDSANCISLNLIYLDKYHDFYTRKFQEKFPMIWKEQYVKHYVKQTDDYIMDVYVLYITPINREYIESIISYFPYLREDCVTDHYKFLLRYDKFYKITDYEEFLIMKELKYG